MSGQLLNKYVWLVETIHRSGKITLKEIRERWQRSGMSDGLDLSPRTFHKWRVAVEELFGLIIENEGSGEYRYYIENADELSNDNMSSWLFNNISVSNLLMESLSIRHKVLLEDVPAGQDFMEPVITALKNDLMVRMTYKGFWREQTSTFDLAPYCLKMFHRRWYLVGQSRGYDKVMIYALDRINELEVLTEHFRYPADFDPAAFFRDSYGIIVDTSCDVELVRLKVSSRQAYYLRTLSLHHSQEEVLSTDQFSLFEMRVRPSFDFRQALLSMGDDLEVLAPEWLREDIGTALKLAAKRYLV